MKKFFSSVSVGSLFASTICVIGVSADKASTVDLNFDIGGDFSKEVNSSGNKSDCHVRQDQDPSKCSKGGMFKTLEENDVLSNKNVSSEDENKAQYIYLSEESESLPDRKCKNIDNEVSVRKIGGFGKLESSNKNMAIVKLVPVGTDMRRCFVTPKRKSFFGRCVENVKNILLETVAVAIPIFFAKKSVDNGLLDFIYRPLKKTCGENVANAATISLVEVLSLKGISYFFRLLGL